MCSSPDLAMQLSLYTLSSSSLITTPTESHGEKQEPHMPHSLKSDQRIVASKADIKYRRPRLLNMSLGAVSCLSWHGHVCQRAAIFYEMVYICQDGVIF